MSSPEFPSALPQPWNRVLPWVWALLLSIGLYCFYTSENQFPYYYHTDEPGKVEQIQNDDFNFNHPLLLLGTTDVLARVVGAKHDPQRIVEIGRNISALFSALGAGLFAVAAWKLRGWPAGIAAGLLIGLHPLYFEAAHYLKEDTALLFGWAFFILAMVMLRERPGLPRVALLGIACGIAVSAKYLGIAAFVLAIPVILLSREKGARLSPWTWPVFIGVFLLTFAIINFPMLRDVDFAQSRIERELTAIAQGGSANVRHELPHDKYFNLSRDYIPGLGWACIALAAFTIVTGWRRRAPAEWVILIFPPLLLVVLSFIQKTAMRYYLPGLMGFVLLAAMGIGDVCRFVRFQNWRWRYGACAVLTAILVAIVVEQELDKVEEFQKNFAKDTRKQLIAWIAKNVPPDAVIAQGRNVRLEMANEYHPGTIKQRLVSAHYLAELGDFDDLLAKGVTHVAISKQELSGAEPGSNPKEETVERWKFYEELQDRSRLLWKSKGGKTVVNTGLWFFELPKASKPSRQESKPEPEPETEPVPVP